MKRNLISPSTTLVATAAFLSLSAGAPPEAIAKPPVKELLGFPVAPGMIELCGGRVYPARPGPHIHWEATTSALKPDALIAWYRKRLGEKGFEKTTGGATWRRGPSDQVEGVLSIQPIQAAGPHSDCLDKAGKGAKTVAIFSVLPRVKEP